MSNVRFHIVQFNTAEMLYPLEDERMADFTSRLDDINALAEGSPGFVWRLKDEGGNATLIRPLGENWLINMSVWSGIAALRDFTYKSRHVELLRATGAWFKPAAAANLALWWVREGTTPSLDDAKARLDHLRLKGPSARAFTFADPFPPTRVMPR